VSKRSKVDHQNDLELIHGSVMFWVFYLFSFFLLVWLITLAMLKEKTFEAFT